MSDTSGSQELSIARIFSEPSLSGSPPLSPLFSPDGMRVTFLRESEVSLGQLDLWHCRVDGADAERLVCSADLLGDDRELSDQEKANRERRRITSTGIVEYLWSPNGHDLIFPVDGRLWRLDLRADGKGLVVLTPDGFAVTDVATSPTGQQISFVRERNLYLVDRDGGTLEQLTFDGSETVTNGIAEFVAQEEMHRFKGYWWSPDGTRIAFTQSDESPIEVSRRYEIEGEDFRVFEQRYPYAGMANALVRLAVLGLGDREVRWLDLGPDDDVYVPRIAWLPDSRHLAVQIQSRNQKRLDLFAYDCMSGERRKLTTETSSTWLNLQQDPWFLKESQAFIQGSERSGHLHLYLHDLEGNLLRPLTAGDWMVHRLLGVDEQRGLCYFTAGIPSPTESRLFRVSLHDTLADPEPITRDLGVHQIEISVDCSHYIDRFSSTDAPPAVALNRIDGTRLAWLDRNDPGQEGHPYAPYLSLHGAAAFGTLAAEDGQTLHYRVTPPSPCRPGARYPLILVVYGGPGVQRVRNEWCALWHQHLAREGYGVLELDNRGSGARGSRFEAPIHNLLGSVEVTDQLRGVEMASNLPWVDGDRIGVYGHSYGGYMTLMLMMKGDGRFRAGVAVAPVTDWRLYDTHYTERYLSLPDDNAEGYVRSSVFPYLDGLRGELMVMHGMADDNVLFTHTTKLIKALQDRNLKFTLMTYPGAKHGLSGRSVNIHRFETVDAFFSRTLKGG